MSDSQSVNKLVSNSQSSRQQSVCLCSVSESASHRGNEPVSQWYYIVTTVVIVNCALASSVYLLIHKLISQSINQLINQPTSMIMSKHT